MSGLDLDAWIEAWYELYINGTLVEDCYIGRGHEDDVASNYAPEDGTEGGRG